ncbi:MAG TPA: hypothetical protein VFN61_07915 [Acidimicrobiales bacterium]|nr:hypothetical protein [Acidimicrobiales bacterium]
MSIANPPLRRRRHHRSHPSAPRRTLTRLLARARTAAADERASQVTDNLGLIVIGVVAIVAIGGLISGLDKTVFNWVTAQLGLG